jgi:transcriptional regulator with XRE-family HTH domain
MSELLLYGIKYPKDPKAFARKIGHRVWYWRKVNGWTQKQLATLAGIHHSNICQIENGRFEVVYYTLFRISNALGIKFQELQFGKLPKKNQKN